MGGVFIKKVVLKLWCIVIVICVFLLGAVGADLQCGNSKVRRLMYHVQDDDMKISVVELFRYLQNMLEEVVSGIKKSHNCINWSYKLYNRYVIIMLGGDYLAEVDHWNGLDLKSKCNFGYAFL